MSKQGRTKLSKKLRFEVFKRDRFTCQYCGEVSPNVVLHVDHVNPLANGGSDDIENLITSCASCNLGKGDRPLSEQKATAASSERLQALEDRREQLAMLSQWRKELESVEDEVIDVLELHWMAMCGAGFRVLTDSGRRMLRKWSQEFSVEELFDAMDASASTYLKYDEHGEAIHEKAELAFAKIPAVVRIRRQEAELPGLSHLFYIRGIIKNRFTRCNWDYRKAGCLAALKRGLQAGWSVDDLRSLALDCASYEAFIEEIDGSDAGRSDG